LTWLIHCNTLQHTATHCYTLQHRASLQYVWLLEGASLTWLIHCNTLQHTAKQSLQHTATRCNTLQHTATHFNTLQHTATRCNTGPHYSAYDSWKGLFWHGSFTATRCNTLQHTATHCNTLQHRASLQCIWLLEGASSTWPAYAGRNSLKVISMWTSFRADVSEVLKRQLNTKNIYKNIYINEFFFTRNISCMNAAFLTWHTYAGRFSQKSAQYQMYYVNWLWADISEVSHRQGLMNGFWILSYNIHVMFVLYTNCVVYASQIITHRMMINRLILKSDVL